MKSVGSDEAKTHLPRLLSQVEKGETITITNRGKPVAVLSPVPQAPRRERRGLPLATRDESLKTAALAVGAALYGIP